MQNFIKDTLLSHSNDPHSIIYVHMLNLTDTSLVEHVISAIRDTILHKTLMECGYVALQPILLISALATLVEAETLGNSK